ncbi:MAG TPA: MATE family efflux transporter, partial [Myxococcota bacterium]|nr:MATE family efflux transporter [Myxococcota bacterium]
MAAFGYRDVLRLAWPNAIAMLSETMMGLVDTKLVAGLGGVALAGVGLGASFFYLVFVTLLGFMRGIKVCTAHALGEGRPQVGLQYAALGAAMVGVIALGGMVALQHAHGFMLAVGIGPEVASEASRFLSSRSWGLPAACAATALMEHRQGLGVVRRPALVGVIGN